MSFDVSVVPHEYDPSCDADDLKVHPANPREGDIGAISVSIQNNGFYGAIVAQKSTGYILAGNHRYMAGCQLGMTHFPVVWVDVDDATARRILLVDNRSSDLATNNLDVLAQHLQEIVMNEGSLDGTGYDGDDLDEILADLDDSIDFGDDEADDESDMLEDRFEVLVECDTEQEQVDLVNDLSQRGFECRALVS